MGGHSWTAPGGAEQGGNSPTSPFKAGGLKEKGKEQPGFS